MTYSSKKRIFYNIILFCILIDEFVKLYLAYPEKMSSILLTGVLVDLMGKWMVAKVANKMMGK